MWYQVLMVYGPSRVEAVKMIHYTFVPKHLLGEWHMQYQPITREGKLNMLFIKHVADA